MINYNPKRQFELTPKEFLAKLDFLNWCRYVAILKELSRLEPKRILEIGPGEGTVKRVYEPFADQYDTMDVNEKLNPTYCGKAQIFLPALQERYDAVIAADILEHIPFGDLTQTLVNFSRYLKPGGATLITIPHRSHYFWWATSLLKDHAQFTLRIPTLKKLLGKKIPIDLDHEWEIGDGEHSIAGVKTTMEKAGFLVEKTEKIPYVDFFVLKKK